MRASPSRRRVAAISRGNGHSARSRRKSTRSPSSSLSGSGPRRPNPKDVTGSSAMARTDPSTGRPAIPDQSDSSRQKRARRARASSRPPASRPSASSTPFTAPALAPLMAAIGKVGSASRRSSTPQVKAPKDPPPCRARASGSARRVDLCCIAAIYMVRGEGPHKFRARRGRTSGQGAAMRQGGPAPARSLRR